MSFVTRLRARWKARKQRKLDEFVEKSLGTRNPIYEETITQPQGWHPQGPSTAATRSASVGGSA
jgi:hypothetical protein